MTSTLNRWPATDKVTEKMSKMPAGVLLQPLNDHSFLPEVECVNFKNLGVLRCRSCRAYINPFIQFVNSYKQWMCNLCGTTNDVPNKYKELMGCGARGPTVRRPELCNASCEIVAPEEYMVRAPQPPVFLFVICVNKRAIDSGMLSLATETITNCLSKLPGMPRTRVGFITYSKHVQFYELGGASGVPKMLNMTDVDKPYLPTPADELLVDLSEHKSIVEDLLKMLPVLHEKYKSGLLFWFCG
eukprot:UN25345